MACQPMTDSYPGLLSETSDTSDSSIKTKKTNDGHVSPPRMKWGHQREFIFTVVGSAIGLGNVWRFPYLCYKYGGGAFFIPYFIFLVFGGIPMMLLEISLGQFMSRGGVEAWSIAPIVKGVGYACLVLIMWINVYYIVILAWTFFYFVQAITGNTPWTDCGQYWNSDCCSNEYSNGTLIVPDACRTENGLFGIPRFPEQEYWSHRVLNITSGIEETGSIQWELVGSLAVMWTVVYACIYNGAKSTGKAAYFTATFPMLMLVILVIRGLTLDGAAEGVKYFLYPDISKLANPEVWTQAGSQVFFSYVSGQGVLTSLGSFNKYSFNVLKWSAALCCLNFFASLLAGLAIFSVLGHMAHEIGQTVDQVAAGGPGLAFVAYPRALNNLPMPILWYLMFFGMILLLGIASQCAETESMCTMMVDLKPEYFSRSKKRRPIFVALCCLFCFCLALPMTTQGGMYLFQLCDSYGASGICLLTIILFETIAVAWIYGRHRFYDDMFNMFGHKMDPRKGLWPIMGIIWQYFTPVVIVGTLSYSFVAWKPPTYAKIEGLYNYPPAGTYVAVFMTMSSIVAIPIYFIYLYIKTQKHTGTVRQTLKAMMEPVYPEDHPYSIQSVSSMEKVPIVTEDLSHP